MSRKGGKGHDFFGNQYVGRQMDKNEADAQMYKSMGMKNENVAPARQLQVANREKTAGLA